MTTETTPPSDQLLRVVSVSLGSSKRNHAVEVEMLGRKLSVERIGTDGDVQRACEMITELDGKVAAIGLGGIDIWLVAGKRKYPLRQGVLLAKCAKTTPVVDGSGLKNTLERETVRWLPEHGVELRGKRVMLVSAVDRFGMAEGFSEAGAQTLFGDLIFALGVPIAMHSLGTVRCAAAMLLPIISRLPHSVLYPTGEKQDKPNPRYHKYFDWAEIVAGDFLYIKRYMPQDMAGKIIVTNTTTEEDVAMLRERGVKTLITTTPELHGRSFGTNVMEGVLVALAGKRPEEMTPEDYLDTLRQLGWQPRVAQLA